MQWLKTLPSSKYKWRHCRLLKACNYWRHCRLRNVDEDIVAFWRHAMTEDIFIFEMQMKVIVAFWKHAITEDIVVFEMWMKTWRSPHAIGLDCLWIATETTIVLKAMKMDDHDGLWMPSDLIVFGWQRETAIVLKIIKSKWPWWSPHANRLACLWLTRETSIVSIEGHWGLQKRADDHYLSLRAIGHACLWIAKVADDHNFSPCVNELACLWLTKGRL